ncbi:flagellar basal body L-ring protein FlgH [Chitinivibrio alkaliphilus]|uniref:Flagellar L-ring protein n=1 Tax=Chitinivibrio alkaliphilus ACht1 TaxID=1313304 RepID=U7DEJ9_9BACT|nr:flagellar basal body L-ring protein FlgH [Chitinivibrio alkaliphilus]ERP39356.1 flagellar L-ring protein [Chitinivibrio alkaliphilus ACht1]
MKHVISLLMLFCTVFPLTAMRVQSMYTNHRALREGDILTVLVQENAEAGTSANTKTRNQGGVNVNGGGGSGLLGFIPRFGTSGEFGAEYDGSGDTKRRGDFRTTISVRVEEVLQNGNLMIQGSKRVKINEEEQLIDLSGVIHPSTISPKNTVYSSNIADAKITYSGQGSNADAQRPGFITRFFNWLF